jgi:muramoyltetrapeptide carboxypeptidase
MYKIFPIFLCHSGVPMDLLLPERLRTGDLVAVVSPASALDDPSRLDAGVRYLQGLGYRVTVGENVGRRSGYLAGTDEERAADLNAMFRNRSVRAIFCLRGGYGSPRILPFLDFPAIRRNPKIFVGYSDITALQLAFLARCALVTFHGPMVGVDMAGAMEPRAEESLWMTLTHPSPRTPIGRGKVEVRGAGRARRPGRLLGGNLSLVAALLGSKFSPSYRNALLCLEETGEEPYRVDRMMVQLANAGILDSSAALCTGAFTNCEAREKRPDSAGWGDVLRDVASRHGLPWVSGLPFGHIKAMATLPLGVVSSLDLSTGLLERTGASVR